MFILLPGGWTGDMWHCVAATALCQSEMRHVVAAYPVTVIGMKEKVSWVPDVGETIAVSPGNSVLEGSHIYNYFHSIQIPVLLARINKLETQFRPVFGKNLIASTEYMNKIIVLYRTFYDQPGGLCSVMWSVTPETDQAANFSTFQIPPEVAKPNSLTNEVLFPDEVETLKLANIDVSPPYEFDGNEEILAGPGPMMHVWASTTVIMQYLIHDDVRAGHIQYLQEQLGQISKADSAWVQRARRLSDKLVMLATQEGVDRSNEKKVVIFNYCKSDVNKQHDGNIALLSFVAVFAEKKGFAVIALVENLLPDEIDYIRIHNIPVLELYPDGQSSYDKRYTPAFWTIVVNELQGTLVHGVIGGRGGSMEIASLMGVNTCTFDEPIFNEESRYGDAYVLAQGGPLLRLLSLHPITSIVYVKKSSWYKNDTKCNAYQELDERGLGEWLDRNLSDPHICPALSAAEVRVSVYDALFYLTHANPSPSSQKTEAGAKSLQSTLTRMEHDIFRIKALSLRRLLGLQAME